jgi:hypothetical protein
MARLLVIGRRRSEDGISFTHQLTDPIRLGGDPIPLLRHAQQRSLVGGILGRLRKPGAGGGEITKVG